MKEKDPTAPIMRASYFVAILSVVLSGLAFFATNFVSFGHSGAGAPAASIADVTTVEPSGGYPEPDNVAEPRPSLELRNDLAYYAGPLSPGVRLSATEVVFPGDVASSARFLLDGSFTRLYAKFRYSALRHNAPEPEIGDPEPGKDGPEAPKKAEPAGYVIEIFADGQPATTSEEPRVIEDRSNFRGLDIAFPAGTQSIEIHVKPIAPTGGSIALVDAELS